MENIDRDYECIDLLEKLTKLNRVKSMLVLDLCNPIKNYFVLQKQNASNGFFSKVIKLKNIWIYYLLLCISLILNTCFVIPISMILIENIGALKMTDFIFIMSFLCVVIYIFLFKAINSRTEYERLIYKMVSRINLQIYYLENKIVNLDVY